MNDSYNGAGAEQSSRMDLGGLAASAGVGTQPQLRGLPQALENLMRAVGRLDQIAGQVEKQIDPLLRPGGPTSKGQVSGKDPQTASMLVRGINEMAQRVDAIGSRLSDAADRLDL